MCNTMELLSFLVTFGGFILLTNAVPPVINSTPKPTLHSDATGYDVTSGILDVSDADGDLNTCVVTSLGLPFNVQFSSSSNGFLMTFVCTNPSSLTASSYSVNIQCSDAASSTVDGVVVVTISSNSPPAPASGSSLQQTVTIDISTTYLTYTILHKVNVEDPDSDPVTCTPTSVPAYISVDANDCTIRNTIDLRSLTSPSSAVIDVSVSDGINADVAFRRTLTFINLNRGPVFAALPSVVAVQETVTSSDVLFTFSATDDQTFSRTMTVDTGSDLFAFSSAAGTLKLASGKQFDYEAGTRVHIITCEADDTFIQSTATVTLSIQNANEAPKLLPSASAVSVKEGPADSMSTAVPVTCTDPDSGDTYTFSMLAGATNSDYFTFPNPATPTMSNLKELDREGPLGTVLTVTIVCTDSGGLYATAQVTVTITDDNDNDPEFVTSSLIMKKIYVGMSSGSILGTLQATDIDAGSNADVTFSLGSASSLVSVQANGIVSLIQKVTETYGSVVSFDVIATDHGTTPRLTTKTITLIWNEPPDITNLPGSAQVPEDPDIERAIFVLKTSDPENDVVTCDVTAVDPPDKTGSNAFEVRVVAPGDLRVFYTASEDLDRTVASTFILTVTASDGKGGQSSNQLTVEVTPNTLPAVSCAGSAPFAATVDVTTAAVHDVVKTITVSDVENDVITYTMTASPNSGSFMSDGTGGILVARDLKEETTVLHTLSIAVSDGVNPDVMCALSITLIHLNEPPEFKPHDLTVEWPDSTAASTTLFQFSITDNEPFTVSWDVSPPADAGFFQLDSSNFEVKLAPGKAFDYETKTTQFVITCTADDTYFESTSSVTIVVLDTNDPPKFQAGSLQISVNEGKPGTLVFLPDYRAVDPDRDLLTFTLEIGTYSTWFSIDQTDGTLTNLVNLDIDGINPVNPIAVEVTATDPYGATDTTSLTIFINDTNDNPPEFDLPGYEFKIGLSSLKGLLLGKMNVSDKDDGMNAQWTLVVTSQTPPGYVTVEADGRVFLSHDLDLEYGTLISLDVEARDKGSPALTSTVVIDVIWNQGPKILNLPAAAYANEDWTAQTEIFALDVIDPETDQYTCVRDDIRPSTIGFDVIDKGDKDFAVFYTGAVTLSVKDIATYELDVRCYNENGEVTKTLLVTVRSNTAPVLPCSPQASVSIDALTIEQGDPVYTIEANDAELDPLEFAVTSSQFYVGRYSGIVRSMYSLKTATDDEFAVSVAVKDHAHIAYCTVFIYLTNMNEVPVFKSLSDTVDVPETTAGGSTIYVIDVIDPNIFGTDIGITWSSAYKSKFEIVVSKLTVTVKLAQSTVLDYESNPTTFTLNFVASDGYLTSEAGTLTVQVIDVNEPPVFHKEILNYYATFLEISDPPEVQSLGCSVVDPDANDLVTLTLSGPNADLFTIADLDNCQMTLATEYDLDSGLTSPATLKLTATDREGLSTVATVIVTIKEINDHDPEFSGPTQLTIDLSMKAGDTIGSVAATDKDSGTNGAVSYAIVQEPLNADEANKYINFLSTGKFVLRTSMAPYVGSSENYRYVITATDYGNPARSSSTTVNVVFDPVNNTTPPPPTTTTAATSSSSDLLEEPFVLGLLIAMVCLAALLAAVGFLLIYKYCFNKSGKASRAESYHRSNTDIESRSTTPVRTNKISVQGLGDSSSNFSNGNTPLSGLAEGRKISTLRPPYMA